MRPELLKPGMKLYDRHTYRMGNTTMRTLGEWGVVIVSMTPGGAMVRWNGNRPEFWPNHRLRKLKTWSMYDKDLAEYDKGMMGIESRARLKKGKKAPPPRMVELEAPRG